MILNKVAVLTLIAPLSVNTLFPFTVLHAMYVDPPAVASAAEPVVLLMIEHKLTRLLTIISNYINQISKIKNIS